MTGQSVSIPKFFHPYHHTVGEKRYYLPKDRMKRLIRLEELELLSKLLLEAETGYPPRWAGHDKTKRNGPRRDRFSTTVQVGMTYDHDNTTEN